MYGSGTVWQLEVCWWRLAVEAGVRPHRVASHGYGEGRPGEWSPHGFLFREAPSRDDFLRLCKRLPWTSVWDADVFPAIARSPWPMVDWMHKASHAELSDDLGRVVGEVRVHRQDVFENAGYDRSRIAIEHKALERAIGRIPEAARSDAYTVVMRAENVAQEALSLLPDDVDRATTSKVVRETFRKALKLAGLKK